MNSTSVVIQSRPYVRWITLGLLLAALWAYVNLPGGQSQTDPEGIVTTWPEISRITTAPNNLFNRVHTTDSSSTSDAEEQERFKLRGTFEQLGSQNRQIAIIDDLQSGKQLLLHQGQEEDGLKVEEVWLDKVRITQGGHTREILFTLSGQPHIQREATTPDDEEEDDGIFRFDDLEAIRTGPFGKQVAPDRWVLKREALLGYHQEMMQDPERLANIYLSWRTDYNESREVAGYQLQPIGEQDFFSEMGMKSGDIIRKVNSMEMINQRRAEYFIRTFTEDKLPTVVLEVEREGKPTRLIYHIR